MQRASALHALGVALAVLGAPRAAAFDYKEHRDVSNEALARATEYALARYPACGGCLEAVLVLAGPRSSPFGSQVVTFGDLAALVDYTGYPWEFLHRRGYHEGDNPGGLQLLDLDNVAKLKGEFFKLLHASNLDQNHFQNNAQASFFAWHFNAVSLAALGNEPDLDRALVTEAYAEHFLEDFFAPGHVLTPRESLHAIASMTLHDRFNARRTPFTVPSSALQRLECFFRDQRVYQRILSSGTLDLLGDGRLSQGKENPDQAEFMAAVVARSAADVIETWLHATGRAPGPQRTPCRNNACNSFLDWDYAPYQLEGKESHSPRLAIAFGSYEPQQKGKFPFGRVSPIYLVQAGFDAVHGEGGSTGRYRFEVEWIPFGSPGKRAAEGQPRFLLLQGLPQFGIGVRYGHTTEHGAHSDGLGAQLFIPVTLVDLQLSLAADYRRYHGDLDTTGRWDVEAKVEFGYGVIYAGVGVARAHHWVEPGRLESGWALTATLSLMKPHTLIQKLLSKEKGVDYPPHVARDRTPGLAPSCSEQDP